MSRYDPHDVIMVVVCFSDQLLCFSGIPFLILFIYLYRFAASIKSHFGHTEGTAGLHGAVGACEALVQRVKLPIMHLRNLNPYAVSAFNEWDLQRGLVSMAPRSSGPLYSSVQNVSGCSSFGMSGTNAHGIFSSALQTSGQHISLPKAHWLRQRLWPVPILTKVIDRVYLSSQTKPFRFNVPISSTHLAFLHDHVIQGTAIMPGAAMIDTCLTASVCSCDSEKINGRISLLQASIPAPFVLSATNYGKVLEVQLDIDTGELSLSAIGKTRTTHFSVTAAQIPNTLLSQSSMRRQEGGANFSLKGIASTSLHQSYLRPFARIESLKDNPHGFQLHPAVLDNVLQLGAAALSLKNHDRLNTRVIAGFDALTSRLNAPESLRNKSQTVAECPEGSQARTILTRHWLSDQNGNNNYANIMGLQSRVIQLDKAMSKLGIEKSDQRLVYFIEWQSDDLFVPIWEQAPNDKYLFHRPSYILRNSKEKTRVAHYQLHLGEGRDAVVTQNACATHVMLLQSLTKNCSPGSILSLETWNIDTMPTPSYTAGSLRASTSSSVRALFRVAAKEYQIMKWRSLDVIQNMSAGNSISHVHSSEGDAYGRTIGPGTLQKSLLKTHSEEVRLSSEQPKDPIRGTLMITGGMGALGILMTTWLANSCRLGLIGRTGRTSNADLPSSVLNAEQEIICFRGDVSASEEAQNGVRQLRGFLNSPLRGIMHAGAVLNSKILMNVTSDGIRNEYGGELTF